MVLAHTQNLLSHSRFSQGTSAGGCTIQGANSFHYQVKGGKQQITICSKDDQLNKIKTFLLMIFVERSDKNKMMLLEDKDQHCFATATMRRQQFNVGESLLQ